MSIHHEVKARHNKLSMSTWLHWKPLRQISWIPPKTLLRIQTHTGMCTHTHSHKCLHEQKMPVQQGCGDHCTLSRFFILSNFCCIQPIHTSKHTQRCEPDPYLGQRKSIPQSRHQRRADRWPDWVLSSKRWPYVHPPRMLSTPQCPPVGLPGFEPQPEWWQHLMHQNHDGYYGYFQWRRYSILNTTCTITQLHVSKQRDKENACLPAVCVYMCVCVCVC